MAIRQSEMLADFVRFHTSISVRLQEGKKMLQLLLRSSTYCASSCCCCCWCCRVSLCRVACRFPFRLCQLHVAHSTTAGRSASGRCWGRGIEGKANDWKRPGNCTSGTYANRSGLASPVRAGMLGRICQWAFCQTNCRLQFCQAGNGDGDGINKNVACNRQLQMTNSAARFPLPLFPLSLPAATLFTFVSLSLSLVSGSNFGFTVHRAEQFPLHFGVQKLHCNG